MAKKDGIGPVLSIASKQLALKTKLFRARSKNFVDFDGCRFNLAGVPNTPMKLTMLEGRYEEFERRAVQSHLDPKIPVIELGGCIGVVACITNRLLERPEAHIVVEANPLVLPLLEESRRDNQCKFEVVHGAIAYGPTSVTFTPERDLWANSLGQKQGEETVTVNAVRLRDLVEKAKFETFNLVCDIEGHEYDLVMHDTDVLHRVDTIVLETHGRVIGEEKNSAMLRKLEEIGFHLIEEESHVVVMKRFPETTEA